MTRVRRLLLILALVVVVAVGLLVVGAKLYLRSSHVTAQVATRLQSLVGAPVEVGGVDIGVNGSSLSGLKLYEPEAKPDQKPWAEVRTVQADVSAWDLVRGLMPQHLALHEAAITLHFDKAGRLLTKLPSSGDSSAAMPEVRLEQGRLEIVQDGHEPMVIRDIDADLKAAGDDFTLTGTVHDPTWHDWTLEGKANRKTMAGSATLKTTKVIHVTQPMLERLPFVYPSIWQEVKLDGDTPAEFNLRTGAGGKEFHYRISLQPEQTKVTVPAVELTGAQCRAKVDIDDGIIHLRDGRGRVAGGELDLNADMDFLSTPDKLSFQVVAKKLDVKELPKNWSLPQQIEGHLDGKADLVLLIRDGHVTTSGAGKGVIADARVAGLPAEPIQLRLHTDGKGYQFQSQQAALPVNSGELHSGEPNGQSFLPLWAVNESVRGLTDAIQGAAAAGARAVHRASQFIGKPAPAPAAPAAPPSYLDVNLALRDADVQQLVKGLNVELPFPVSGRLTFRVRASIPLNAAKDLKAYRFDGNADAARLMLDTFDFEKVHARVSYREGVLRLDELTANVPADAPPQPAGSLQGTAQLQVVPRGDLTAELKVQRIPISQATKLVPDLQKAGGSVSGDVHATIRQARLGDIKAWQVNGTVSSERVEAFGVAMDDAAGKVSLDKGVLVVADLRGRLQGAPVTAAGDLNLSRPYRYKSHLELHDLSLAALDRIAPGLRPPMAVSGSFRATADLKGSLSPFAVEASGTAAAKDLRAEGVRVAAASFDWDTDTRRLRLTKVHGNLYQGKLTGEAVVPLHADLPGNFNFQVADLDTAALSADIPAMPVRLDGRASGTVQGTLAPAGQNQARVFNAKMTLQAPRLLVQGIPTEKLQGDINYKKSELSYRLTGDSLGGKFDLNGTVPSAQQPALPPPAQPQGRGRLRVQGVRLSRLWRAFQPEGGPGGLRGLFDFDLSYRVEGPQRTMNGRGSFSLRNLGWGSTGFTQSDVTGTLLLERNELRFRGINGVLAQGEFRAAAGWRMGGAGRSWFNIALDNADSTRLLSPWPGLASRISGPVDFRLHGNFGHAAWGHGSLSMARGRVEGIEVTNWHFPFDFTFDHTQGFGELVVRETTATVAHGRVTGSGRLTARGPTELRSQFRFADVDLRELLRQLSESSQFAAGKITGRADLWGSNVRSVNDLAGTVDLKLRDTQPKSLPVLSQIIAFLGPMSSSSTYTSGDMRGRLGGGVFRLDRLSLAGGVVPLFISGLVTTQGRLDLDVLVQTQGLGTGGPLMRLLGIRLPATGPIPLNLLAQASTLLANRLIRLHVGGTVRSPSIQVQPVAMLAEEAVRYFLTLAPLP